MRSDYQVTVDRKGMRTWKVQPLAFGGYMQGLGSTGPSEESLWVRLEAHEDMRTQTS